MSSVCRILLGEPPVTSVNTRNPACPTLPGSRGVPSAGAEFLASRPTPDRQLVALVLAARAGDSAAWTELLGRFDRILGACRPGRLSAMEDRRSEKRNSLAPTRLRVGWSSRLALRPTILA